MVSARDVIAGKSSWSVEQSDCITWLDSLPEGSVDLVFGSPPYLDARTYGIDAVYGCQEWVDWMLKVTTAAVRVSKGLVLWVCAGVQRELCYWPGCEGLAWEWWKLGNHLWRPCIWWKVDAEEGGTGIPGSGGKQWLRNDWEYVLAFKRAGWLPWADPLVFGHEPVCDEAGGEMSNRTADGRRINARVFGDPWKTASRGGQNCGGRTKDGRKKKGRLPGSTRRANGKYKAVERDMDAPAGSNADGTRKDNTRRPMPAIVNPGNCVIVKARVGGGHMGSKLCHDNEAPFPEELATFFACSFCPPGGIIADCFAGSGTTLAVALRHGRRAVGCDLRASQVALTEKRVSTETPLALFNEAT
jgi:hypothetical protein